jgi:hypothetical protein
LPSLYEALKKIVDRLNIPSLIIRVTRKGNLLALRLPQQHRIGSQFLQ